MKTIINSQIAVSNLDTKITYFSGGGGRYVDFGIFFAISFDLFRIFCFFLIGHFAQSLIYSILPLGIFSNLSNHSVLGLNSYLVRVRCV